ncbi:BUD3 [Candida pseudojiufengensis]|uniref:BUD3 n=1 Tax=Candida pseudojiufengensis TaxID=497109 RepID=UPI0022249406|nr:BUD3 [Candida pseudojiufengensis]KAI5959829.1 BUD3 [Candida pseudojiufengensis]
MRIFKRRNPKKLQQDDQELKKSNEQHQEHVEDGTTREKLIQDGYRIPCLSCQFSTDLKIKDKNLPSSIEWSTILKDSVIFTSYDEILFGNIIILIYKSIDLKISTVSITKYGVTNYKNLKLNHRSRFWPSCENLLPKYKDSKVRRALAITFLKNYSKLIKNINPNLANWDETTAGNLANNASIISRIKPFEFCLKLSELGLLTDHYINSLFIDVLYDNNSNDETTIDENNKLAFLLGDQLNNLSDSNVVDTQVSYNLTNERLYSSLGELISPIASNLPEELKKGWIDRKLIAIREFKNVKESDQELILIFSDYLLILSMFNNTKKFMKMSMQEILTISFNRNERLPSEFPLLHVVRCDKIEHVNVSSYNSAINSTKSTFLEISYRDGTLVNYEVTNQSNLIIQESLVKAKIFRKTSSFHLFKSDRNQLISNYFVAHDDNSYNFEKMKSNILITLNMENKLDVPQYLRNNPNLNLIINLSFIDETQIQVQGYDTNSKHHISNIIPKIHLNDFICNLIRRSHEQCTSNVDSLQTLEMIRSNERVLSYLVDEFKTQDRTEVGEVGIIDPTDSTIGLKKLKSKTNLHTHMNEPEDTKDHMKVDIAQDIKVNVIENTFIPKGTENEYIDILKPSPILQPSSHVKSIDLLHSHQHQQQNQEAHQHQQQKQEAQQPVNSHDSGRNNRAHFNKQSRFQETKQRQDSIPRGKSTNDEVTTSNSISTIKRLATVDDLSILTRNQSNITQLDEIYEDEIPNWSILETNLPTEQIINEDILNLEVKKLSNQLSNKNINLISFQKDNDKSVSYLTEISLNSSSSTRNSSNNSNFTKGTNTNSSIFSKTNVVGLQDSKNEYLKDYNLLKSFKNGNIKRETTLQQIANFRDSINFKEFEI